MLKVNGMNAIVGIDYILNNGVLTVKNKRLLPVNTIEYTVDHKLNRSERRKAR